MQIVQGKNVPIKLWTNDVESEALAQLQRVATLPWIAHLAVMPDVHFDIGATVGSVIAMRGAVSPAAVGVDIGCGMAAVMTSLTAQALPDSLKEVRHEIERSIPVGFNDHANRVERVRGLIDDSTRDAVDGLFVRFGDLTDKVADLEGKARRQIGTLGGGNHFVELCLDTEDNVWLMLHSGSRNIGNVLASHHMSIARKLDHNQGLEDKDLAAFLVGTPEMNDYRHDLYWAQEYARLNRSVMLDLYKNVLRRFWPGVAFEAGIFCHHNYVAEEECFGETLFVTRKGAIRAGVGDMGIIPGSMGTRSYIVRGRGNPESLSSASHGAGRRMSRGAAKRSFTLEDLAAQTSGVECRKDGGVLDEIPGAYKDIDEVMRNQSDLVEVVATLKQVLCVKG